MKTLVVYGSKRGGTSGLAEMVAGALTDEGATVDVASAAERTVDPTGYDAVVIGGALYAGHWHKDARRFVRRYRRVLRDRPVWLFSSGPLDPSAEESDLPPTHQVAGVMEQLAARGHQTFGGRLAPDAQGFPASAWAKTHAGDFRDQDHVRRWAHAIVAAFELDAAPHRTGRP
jgi:menaquinone-dependent protoporphyrinogen oxidase